MIQLEDGGGVRDEKERGDIEAFSFRGSSAANGK